jgi:5'-3' exonuclease
MNVFEQPITNPIYLFIDGSYYCFYRYYSLLNWWKNAYPDEKLDEPFENAIFVEKFKKTFVEHLQVIPHKLKIKNPIMVVGKDCKREDIWRSKLFPGYKENRHHDGFKGKPFFSMAYNDNLFELGGAKATLKQPFLEADDCIAISVKYLRDKYPECQIYIITSDKDYLQLSASNVHLYDLAFKNITENKSSTGDSKKDLEIKTIMGDKSDCIPSVFPKCGFKTAQKCIEDAGFFEKKMNANPEYYVQYELNKKLIDFNNIPDDLVEEFVKTNLEYHA